MGGVVLFGVAAFETLANRTDHIIALIVASFCSVANCLFCRRALTRFAKAWTFAVVVLLSAVAAAGPGDLLFKLTAPDPQPGAWFGKTIASLDGNTIIIGEPNRSIGEMRFVGRAYVFDGNNGEIHLTLNDPKPIDRSSFGTSLAGGDGRIFIGGGGVADRGRVYAFEKQTGNLDFQIESPENAEHGFGDGIAYGESSLVVSSAPFSISPQLLSVGRAYLYNAATGDELLTIPNPEPKRNDVFGIGRSQAVFGDSVAIGAIFDDLPGDNRPDGDNPGRVWVFDRDSGSVNFVIENPNPASSIFDWFGWSVVANEEIIVVGAHEDGTSGIDGSGTVYVFESQTGQLKHTLNSPQLEADGEFGSSLALTPEGDVLIGAWGTSVNGIERAGHVYLFDDETGRMLLDIANPNPHESGFGYSVAAMNGRLIVSAASGDANGLSATGSVYIFESIPEPQSLVLVGSILVTLTIVQAVRKRASALRA